MLAERDQTSEQRQVRPWFVFFPSLFRSLSLSVVMWVLVVVLSVGVAQRTVEQCQAMTAMLDFDHVHGGSLGQLARRLCVRFDWLAVEHRLRPSLFAPWIRKEQLAVALDDVLSVGSLRQCFRRHLKSRRTRRHHQAALDLFEDVQSFRSLPDSFRSADACRLFAVYATPSAPVNLRPLTVALLRSALQRRCVEDSEEPVPPSLFDLAQVDAREQLQTQLISFLAGSDFRRCKGRQFVRRDVKDYTKIRERYCEDEGRSFDVGTPERRRRTIEAMRVSLSEHCRQDPNFNVQEL